MSKCNHENLTIDRYCNDCGYDLIVDDRDDAIRQQEQERIIELLEAESRNCEKAGLWANGADIRGQLQELHMGLNAAIALIKGEK